MPQPKASLEEMAVACQHEADRSLMSQKACERRWPDRPPDNDAYRRIHVLESAAAVLRVMATFEDRSRTFIAALIAEHKGG